MKNKMFLTLLLFTGICYNEELKVLEKNPESCIGEFCLNNKSIPESDLVSRFGPGFVHKKNSSKKIDKKHCYYVPEQNVWVEFGIDYHNMSGSIVSIFISREPLCEKKFVPKKAFQTLATSRNIHIGTLSEDIIRTYGQPTRIDDSAKREKQTPIYKTTYYAAVYGSPVLVYLSNAQDLLTSFFYTKKGLVHSMLITISE